MKVKILTPFKTPKSPFLCIENTISSCIKRSIVYCIVKKEKKVKHKIRLKIIMQKVGDLYILHNGNGFKINARHEIKLI